MMDGFAAIALLEFVCGIVVGYVVRGVSDRVNARREREVQHER